MTAHHLAVVVCTATLMSSIIVAGQDDLNSRINELERDARALRPLNAASGNDAINYSAVEDLEERVHRLELDIQRTPHGIPNWVNRFHLSGNADVVYFYGQDESHSPNSRFAVDNARLFFDVNINDHASFFLEWDIVREAEKQDDFTQLYLRIDRIFDLDALNLQIGRTLIPYGEEYTRFHHERFQNPLITFSAPGAWWWDEGVLVFGTITDSKLQYQFAVMDGDIRFNDNTAEQVQLAGKITYEPIEWATLSLSGLRTGKIGTSSRPGISAMFFGGRAVVPFGSRTDVENYQDGMEIDDDPNLVFNVNSWEIDSIVSSADWGRLWFAYGQVDINSEGESTYDRDLHYWIVEGIVELGMLGMRLDKLYLVTRYSAIGTFDSDEGYSLGAFNEGENLGFNTESVEVISVGIGLRIHENVKLKLEYAWYDFALVDGAGSLNDRADDRNLLGIGMSAKF